MGVRLHRRTLLVGGASAGLAAWLPAGDVYSTTSTGSRMSSKVARRVGPFEVVGLLDADGLFFLSQAEAFPEASDQDWAAAEAIDPDAFAPDGGWRLVFRCFVIHGPRGGTTLVDTGIGPVGSPASWAPQPGQLATQLAAAGIDPGDIDTVVLTHLHEDHYGGSVDLDGTPQFPNARYLVQRTELDTLAPDDVAISYVVDPLRATGQLAAVDGRVRIDRASPVDTSVTLLPTPGHTPGHQSLLVQGGQDRLILTGDALVHAVQLANPNVGYRFEADEGLARQTRIRLLVDAKTPHTLLATAHLNRTFVATAGRSPSHVA